MNKLLDDKLRDFPYCGRENVCKLIKSRDEKIEELEKKSKRLIRNVIQMRNCLQGLWHELESDLLKSQDEKMNNLVSGFDVLEEILMNKEYEIWNKVNGKE